MKKETPIFKPNENPTYEFIYINSEKVKVRLYLNENNKFELTFTFLNKVHKLITEQIKHKDYQIDSNDILFKDLRLSQIEKVKLAKRLNEIIDFNEQ